MNITIKADVDAEFDVSCNDCGNDLKAEFLYKHNTLYVTPCEVCMSEREDNE